MAAAAAQVESESDFRAITELLGIVVFGLPAGRAGEDAGRVPVPVEGGWASPAAGEEGGAAGDLREPEVVFFLSLADCPAFAAA